MPHDLLRITPKALQFLNFLGGDHPNSPYGEGATAPGGTPYIFHIHMCRQNAPLFDDFSLAGHLKNGHLLSICPTNSQASQIIINQ